MISDKSKNLFNNMEVISNEDTQPIANRLRKRDRTDQVSQEILRDRDSLDMQQPVTKKRKLPTPNALDQRTPNIGQRTLKIEQSKKRKADDLEHNPETSISHKKTKLGNIAEQAATQAMLRTALLRTAQKLPGVAKSTLTTLTEERERLIKARKQIKSGLQRDEKNAKPLSHKSAKYQMLIKKINENREKLITNHEKLREIDTKLSYMMPEDSSGQKVKVTNVSAGVNIVEKLVMEDGRVAFKKTLAPDEQQKRFQIDVIGSLSESLPQANVVAARSRELAVATKSVEGLKLGTKAIKELQLDSEVTQHTALAALSFQMWDLHTDNIGIDRKKNLVIFDTDQALFEDNDFVRVKGVLQPPLGHSELQDMNIRVTDTVLDTHIEQLGNAISSQFLGKEHGFTEMEVKIIQQQLIKQFADMPELLVYEHEEYGQNEMLTDLSVDDVRIKFLEMMQPGSLEADAFFEKLRETIIPEEKIQLLQKHSQLLHPKKLSIKQMAVLIERRNHLQGFVELRKGLKNLPEGALSQVQRDLAKKCILKNIDHLPVSTSEKIKFLKNIKSSSQRIVQGAIKEIQLLVSGDKIKWNTLARSMYPTMAAMHHTAETNAIAAKGPCFYSNELSWERDDHDKKVQKPLQQECSRRTEFLKKRI